MTKPDGQSGRTPKRCSECGVELKPGVKYCDFCGRKVAVAAVVSSSAKKQAHGTAGGVLTGLVVVGLAIGSLVYFGNSHREIKTPPAPPPAGADGKRQAASACEAAIRLQVRAPFRVIAFRSSLVAEERGGYAVSGSVELQSATGDLERRRYSCRVHPDPGAGMVLDEARMD